MSMSEKFCLQWKEFHGNVSSCYRDIRKTGEFSDVTLASEDGYEVKCHKLILAASSFYLSSLINLASSPIILEDVSSNQLKKVLDFIYHGEVEVEKEEVFSFLSVGEKLHIRGLTKPTSASIPTNNVTASTFKEEKFDDMEINETDILPEIDDSDILQEIYNLHENLTTSSDNESKSFATDADLFFPCTVCGKGIKSRKDRDAHVKKYHSAARVSNRTLDVSVGSPVIKNEAQKMSEGLCEQNGNFWRCTKCGKQAENHRKHNLFRHAETHLEGVSFPCNKCEKKSKSSHGLAQHIDKNHPEVKEEKLVEAEINFKLRCKFCKKPIKNSKSMYNHIYKLHKDDNMSTVDNDFEI